MRHPVAMFAGIDVGAERLHCVAISRRGSVAGTWLFGAEELRDLARVLARAEVVAVDAPATLSAMPHGDETRLSPKFRVARCAEIALGREYGWWVPWVTPAERPRRGWIETGLRVYEALQALGSAVVEVFPYAGFRSLRPDARLAGKGTVAGVRTRVALLRARAIRVPHAEMWSHDGVDALLGALVARDYADGTARRVGCGHDDSAIWLPAALSS